MSRRPERAPIDHYLDRICRRLWFVSARERRDTREELRQHLTALAVHAARTVSATEAMEDAMEKFGDPKQIAQDLSRQHLRRRRWLSALLKTAAGVGLTLLVLVVGYSAYSYFALSRPLERESVPTPTASGAAALAAIQAAQDGYARQIHSLRFQGTNTSRLVKEWHGLQYGVGSTSPLTYEVASKGKLYYSHSVMNERYGSKLDETIHSEEVNIFDGQTMREVYTEWNGPAGSPRARQTHHVSAYLPGDHQPFDPDGALEYGYKVHDAWIGDVLRRSKPAVEGIVADARFGTLTVVRCRNTTSWGDKEDVRLWFAPKLGWMAIKTEVNWGGSGLLPPMREIGFFPPVAPPGREIRETTRVAKIGTLWVTTEAQRRMDYLTAGRRVPIAINSPLRFTNITLNSVPDSLFAPHYPHGTQFWSHADDAHPAVPVPRPVGL